jgi:hypothetical protein
MAEVIAFPDGGYRFVKGVFPYSAGVAALPGYALERARFARHAPLADGFAAIAAHLRSLGRPLTALTACELRSPAPFTDEGFMEFNRGYVATLTEWGLFRDGVNPVGRSNLAPAIAPPSEPGFFAFTYTVPAGAAPPSFVIAGSGESPEGRNNYRDNIIARGDTSPAGMLVKARWVLAEQERRLGALGFGWGDTTATQVYTVHDIHPLIATELARCGASGIAWHFVRPPVVGLDYEMDCRGVHVERVLA